MLDANEAEGKSDGVASLEMTVEERQGLGQERQGAGEERQGAGEGGPAAPQGERIVKRMSMGVRFCRQTGTGPILKCGAQRFGVWKTHR